MEGMVISENNGFFIWPRTDWREMSFFVVVSEIDVSATGFLVIAVDGKFSGPVLNVTTNYNVVVNVLNSLDEELLITWAGIQQRKNSWQHGVLGTNCPIPSGWNWTYQFHVKDQISSFIYFPSLGLQRAVGGYGGITINNSAIISVPFGQPDPDDYPEAANVENSEAGAGDGKSSASSDVLSSDTSNEEKSRSSSEEEGDSSPTRGWTAEKSIGDGSCDGGEGEEKAVEAMVKESSKISEIEMMKVRFSKLLLGDDMSGCGNGVSTALTISNAITNLCAPLFGQLWRLVPLPSDKEVMWRREMEWLLCVADHIVELIPSCQTFPEGTKLKIMTCRPRSDMCINLPALRKLDNLLLEMLDSFNNAEFWYVDQGVSAPESDNSASFRKHTQRQEEKWWLPVPRVPCGGLQENTRKHLQHKSERANQNFKAAMAINSNSLAESAPQAVEKGDLTIIPERFEKIYKHWLSNIKVWCISRQLWSRHRIPVWHITGKDCEEDFIVARNQAEALEKAKEMYGKGVEICQDSDVLDTWFSSALWPFSTLGWPDASALGLSKFADMVISVLIKQEGLKLQHNAIFLNIVSGFKLEEPAGDLPIAAAICSSFLGVPIPKDVAFIGEIGLGGELRRVPRMDKRVNAISKLGYRKCVIPKTAEKLLIVAEDVESDCLGNFDLE